MTQKKTARLKSVKKTTKIPSTAPGQTLGYGLQYTRLTAMLLTSSEGSSCSIEVLDDVAEERATGEVHLVQSKSALTGNPVSDRAMPLWKTLFNWLELAKRDLIRPATTIFEIYVSRPADGEIVNAFSSAETIDKAIGAITHARQTLWGAPPIFPLREELSDDIARYVNCILEADQSLLAPIIKNMRLTCGSGSPQADIETTIRSHPVSPSKVSDIADHMCGWVKRQVDMRLEKSLPAVISRDDFHRKYRTYCQRVDRETILKSSASVPTREQRLTRLPDIFVQQLSLIELDFEEQLAAISDFLMACADRTNWAKSGEVDETSFDELDEVLTRMWRSKARANHIEYQDKKEADRGQLLYWDCMEYKVSVQEMSTPPHFNPGCLHRLADFQMVGWHPRFKKLLETPISAESA